MHESNINTPMLVFLKAKGWTRRSSRTTRRSTGRRTTSGGRHVQRGAALHGPAPARPCRRRPGLPENRDYLTYNGVTTVADMNTGGTNYDLEMSSLKRNFDVPDSPVRVRLTPDVMKLAAALKSPSGDETGGRLKARTRAPDLQRRHQAVRRRCHVLAGHADWTPGYIDGMRGMDQPARSVRGIRAQLLERGYQIHVHTNGDGGPRWCSTPCRRWRTKSRAPITAHDRTLWLRERRYCASDRQAECPGFGQSVLPP